METRLQSNEIRIPKPEFHLKSNGGGGCGIMSGGDLLNTSSGSSGSNYFKSSFARSLSTFGSSPQSKSLDFTINYGYPQIFDEDEGHTLINSTALLEHCPMSMPHIFSGGRGAADDCFLSSAGKVGIEHSTESLASSSSVATTVKNVWTGGSAQTSSNGIHKAQVNCSNSVNDTKAAKPVVGDDCGGVGGGVGAAAAAAELATKATLRKLHHRNNSASVCDSTEIEVLRLRKECQNLIEENRRLLNLAGMGADGGGGGHHASNVEAVILQSHVDTLQWQLKQVESSRQMYRAVMEEVVRFLERCHHSLDSLVLEEPISRSKSSHHVHQDADSSHLSNCSDNDHSLITSPSPPPGKQGMFTSSRLRCSTIDAPKLFNRNLSTSGINNTMQTAGSYTNFRDFTWRRNRKPLNRTMSTMEMDPEKLSQEAFRLLRTANNLLNTHEPSLAMPKSIFDSTYSSPTPSPHLMNQSLNSSFCRKSNGRQSSTSMRSCCDTNSTSSNSSGASSASSSQKAPLALDTETDDIPNLISGCSSSSSSSGGNGKTGKSGELMGGRNSHPASMMMHSEAESGFSSISSFQEIGLPLINSTLIGHGVGGGGRSNGACSSSNASDDSTAECDLTIQAAKDEVPPILPKRLPVVHQYSHRRWDSAPALPPKKSSTLHAFHGVAGKGEESLRVLWV